MADEEFSSSSIGSEDLVGLNVANLELDIDNEEVYDDEDDEEEEERLQPSKFTQRSNRAAATTLREFLQLIKEPETFEDFDVPRLAAILKQFYTHGKRRDGEAFKVSSLESFRYSLSRYLKSPPFSKTYDIMRDPAFDEANKCFSITRKELKRMGKGVTTHFQVICEQDRKKLYTSVHMNPSVSAWGLANKVQFDIRLYFCRSGVENMHKLPKDAFEIRVDHHGIKYVAQVKGKKIRSGAHHEANKGLPPLTMPEERGSPYCPVKSYEMYISKLNPECNRLWQYPRDPVGQEETCWFTVRPMGHNTLSAFMPRLSKLCSLSRPYTNHSIKVTGNAMLSRLNLSLAASQVMCVNLGQNSTSGPGINWNKPNNAALSHIHRPEDPNVPSILPKLDALLPTGSTVGPRIPIYLQPLTTSNLTLTVDQSKTAGSPQMCITSAAKVPVPIAPKSPQCSNAAYRLAPVYLNSETMKQVATASSADQGSNTGYTNAAILDNVNIPSQTETTVQNNFISSEAGSNDQSSSSKHVFPTGLYYSTPTRVTPSETIVKTEPEDNDFPSSMNHTSQSDLVSPTSTGAYHNKSVSSPRVSAKQVSQDIQNKPPIKRVITCDMCVQTDPVSFEEKETGIATQTDPIDIAALQLSLNSAYSIRSLRKTKGTVNYARKRSSTCENNSVINVDSNTRTDVGNSAGTHVGSNVGTSVGSNAGTSVGNNAGTSVGNDTETGCAMNSDSGCVINIDDEESDMEVDGEELQPLPDENLLEVTCGQLKAYLHRDKFYCPGIHRECIEFGDVFITPKNFSVMGEKAKLKDWKNAVRYNGVQLRKYIDSGILQFANHDSVCTGRCVARAAGSRGPNTRVGDNPIGDAEPYYHSHNGTGGFMQLNSYPGGANIEWHQGEDEEEDIKPDVKQLQMQMMAATHQLAASNNAIQPATVVTTTPTPTFIVQHSQDIQTNREPDMSELTEEDKEDRTLWKGIIELGLVDEFFREIKASLDVLKNGMIRRHVPYSDSRRISVIVKQLGLMQKLKFKLEAHQTDMERQRMKLDREMEELQRKVREYEYKKEMLKRKSECFEQLLDITLKEEPRDEATPAKQICVATDSVPKSMVVFPNQAISRPMKSLLKTDLSAAVGSEEQSFTKIKPKITVNIMNHPSSDITGVENDSNWTIESEHGVEENITDEGENTPEAGDKASGIGTDTEDKTSGMSVDTGDRETDNGIGGSCVDTDNDSVGCEESEERKESINNNATGASKRKTKYLIQKKSQ